MINESKYESDRRVELLDQLERLPRQSKNSSTSGDVSARRH